MRKILKLALVCLLTLSITSPVKSLGNGGKSGICFTIAAGLALTNVAGYIADIANYELTVAKYPQAFSEERRKHINRIQKEKEKSWLHKGLALGSIIAGAAGVVFAGKALFGK